VKKSMYNVIRAFYRWRNEPSSCELIIAEPKSGHGILECSMNK